MGWNKETEQEAKKNKIVQEQIGNAGQGRTISDILFERYGIIPGTLPTKNDKQGAGAVFAKGLDKFNPFEIIMNAIPTQEGRAKFVADINTQEGKDFVSSYVGEVRDEPDIITESGYRNGMAKYQANADAFDFTELVNTVVSAVPIIGKPIVDIVKGVQQVYNSTTQPVRDMQTSYNEMTQPVRNFQKGVTESVDRLELTPEQRSYLDKTIVPSVVNSGIDTIQSDADRQAVQGAIGGQQTAIGQYQEGLTKQYAVDQANVGQGYAKAQTALDSAIKDTLGYYQPYLEAGNRALGKYEGLVDQGFKMSNLEADPVYQEATGLLNKQLAARGLSQSVSSTAANQAPLLAQLYDRNYNKDKYAYESQLGGYQNLMKQGYDTSGQMATYATRYGEATGNTALWSAKDLTNISDVYVNNLGKLGLQQANLAGYQGINNAPNYDWLKNLNALIANLPAGQQSQPVVPQGQQSQQYQQSMYSQPMVPYGQQAGSPVVNNTVPLGNAYPQTYQSPYPSSQGYNYPLILPQL